MATLQQIFISPIKSCRLIEVDWAIAGPTGLRNDRMFMVVDRKGSLVSQRTHPKMVLIGQRLERYTSDPLEPPDALVLSYPDDQIEDLRISLSATSGEEITATVHGKQALTSGVSAEADAWFTKVLNLERLGRDRPYRLVHCLEDHPRLSQGPGNPSMTFQDAYPYTVITSASMAEVNRHIRRNRRPPVDADRFRPTFVVADSGDEGGPMLGPNEEDEWESFSIGLTMFSAHGPVDRCAVPQVDPDDGLRYHEPMQALRIYRRGDQISGDHDPKKVYMAAYAHLLGKTSHVVSVGMSVEAI